VPTYGYRCEACGSSFEKFARFAEFKPQEDCSCGAVASSVISGGGAPIVRGMPEYKFDPRKNSLTPGQNPAAVERRYAKKIGEMQAKAREWNKSAEARRDGWECEAILPAPMADSIGRREGDIEAFAKDPIPFAKATGTYVGRDK
jgi:putative FmdB family regulatory protein